MDEFFKRQDELVQVHPDAMVLEQGETTLTQGGTRFDGYKAVYDFEDVFRGESQPLRSELHIFGLVGDTWYVKYRITYPRERQAGTDMGAFMQALTITIPPM